MQSQRSETPFTVPLLVFSHWQGRIDFDKVKSQGYSFVMINAGYGKYISQKDENFEKNYAAARKAGLNIGTYWYSYALTEADALAEAKTFLEAVKGKMFEYPLAFDIEDASQSELPNAAINKIIEAFCDYLESNGYYAAVYSYANFFKRKVSDSVKNRYDIWVAHFDVAKPAISNYGMWETSMPLAFSIAVTSRFFCRLYAKVK